MYRHLIRQIGIYGVGAVISPLVSAILVPIYARVLLTSEFGELAVIEAAQSFFALFAGLRLKSSVLRVYYLYDSQDERNAVLNTCITTGFVAAVLIAGLLLAANTIFDVSQSIGIENPAGYNLALLILIPTVIREVVLAALRAQQRARAYVLVSLISLVSLCLAKILFVAILKQGVLGSLRGGLAGGLVGALVGLLLMKKGLGSWVLSRGALRHSLRFGVPLLPAGFFAWVLQTTPRYFLLWNFSAVEVGVYALAAKAPALMALLILEPIRRAWQPIVYGLETEALQRQAISKSLYGIMALICTGSVAISLFAHEITIFVLSNRHATVAQFIPPLALWVVLQATLMPLGVAINIRSKTEFISISFLFGAMVMVSANAVLTPAFGIWGTVAAVDLSYLAILIAYAAIVRRIFPIDVSWPQLSGIPLVGIAYFLVGSLLSGDVIWLCLIGKLLLIVLFVLTVVFGRLLGPLHDTGYLFLRRAWESVK